MTVLVLIGSSHIGARIIDRLSKINDLVVVEGNHQSADAVRLIDEMKPEIVILDAQLGDGAGIEVLRRTKSLPSSHVVMMIATSPHTQYYRESMREGADYFFQLPAEVEGLTHAIIQCKASTSR
jgi:DNA-binding NarL/FixJ family response regulator